MKQTIMILLMGLVVACSTLPEPRVGVQHASSHSHTVRARITYYTGHQTASGKRAVQGQTAAAHPKRKFGTKVVIPELYQYLGDSEFRVEDRGPAVTKMKASHGNTEVFDIYVSNKSTMRRLEHDAPEYMTVEL